MNRIGLTGNIGSGKSTVARIFEALDVPVFYSDLVARQMYSLPEVVEKLTAFFPEANLYSGGKFQKAILANLIFSNPQALQQVNQLIHPLVEEEFVVWSVKHTHRPYVLQESAILFENHLQQRYNAIILVTAPESLRVQRVTLRDDSSPESVKARISNQMPETEKQKLSDYIINNDGHQMLIPQVVELHQKLTQLRFKPPRLN